MWIHRMPGYIASIAINSMMVLKASTVSTSFMMVWPVSRSTAPWIFRRSRPLLCSTATGSGQPAGAPFMAEARQTLDPVLLIQLVPQPDCVVVKQQHFSDRLTAQFIVQQCQRVGAAGQAMLGGTVAGQLNQVASRFAIQEPRADHGSSRIASTPIGKFAGFLQSRGIS